MLPTVLSGLLILCVTATAQSVMYREPSKAYRRVHLPPQFSVTADSLNVVIAGKTTPRIVAWESIDLVALATEEPQINEARQNAALTGRSTYFTVTPPPNYYRAFLETPINIKFNSTYRVTSVVNSRYAISATGYIQATSSSTALLQAQGFLSAETVTQTRIVDTTRYPLATTTAGVITYISDTKTIESQRLILALQETGYFFPNLLIGLRNLAQIYPTEQPIRTAIDAFERLAYEKTVHIDSQVRAREFLAWCTNQSKRQ